MAELDRRGTYTFVHPGMPPYREPLGDLHPPWLYEFPFETTRAITNLVYSGTFERHPSIRFQFAHLGGTAPFLADRLASLALREPDKAAQATAGIAEYLRRQYYDTGLTQFLPALEATRRSRRSTTSCSGPTGPTRRSPRRATTRRRTSRRSRLPSARHSTPATPPRSSRG